MDNVDQVITIKEGQKFNLGNTVYYFILGSDDEWSLVKDE